MPWLIHTDPTTIHVCKKPGLYSHTSEIATFGDIWECDECNQKWIVKRSAADFELDFYKYSEPSKYRAPTEVIQ